MHNLNTEALDQTIAKAQADNSALKQTVSLDGAWQTHEGQPQFRAILPVPNGKPVVFEADFPAAMGGTGSAPSPLAYCFWGGLACYAMTYAQEAARHGVELRSLRATADAEVDMSSALGVTSEPPVQRIQWTLEVNADADQEKLAQLKALADDHCPGVYCLRNSIELHTEVRS